MLTPQTESLLFRIEGLMLTTHRTYTQSGYTLETVEDDKGDSPAFAVVDDETGFIVAIDWLLVSDEIITALELVCPVEEWFADEVDK